MILDTPIFHYGYYSVTLPLQLHIYLFCLKFGIFHKAHLINNVTEFAKFLSPDGILKSDKKTLHGFCFYLENIEVINNGKQNTAVDFFTCFYLYII